MDPGAMVVDAVSTAVPAGTQVGALVSAAPKVLVGVLAVPREAVVADLAPDLAPVPGVRRPEPAVRRISAGIPPRPRPATDAARGVMIGVMDRRNN